jgi:hypothetical protein
MDRRLHERNLAYITLKRRWTKPLRGGREGAIIEAVLVILPQFLYHRSFL